MLLLLPRIESLGSWVRLSSLCVVELTYSTDRGDVWRSGYSSTGLRFGRFVRVGRYRSHHIAIRVKGSGESIEQSLRQNSKLCGHASRVRVIIASIPPVDGPFKPADQLGLSFCAITDTPTCPHDTRSGQLVKIPPTNGISRRFPRIESGCSCPPGLPK